MYVKWFPKYLQSNSIRTQVHFVQSVILYACRKNVAGGLLSTKGLYIYTFRVHMHTQNMPKIPRLHHLHCLTSTKVLFQ